jgi:hypothetical protein
MERSFIVDIGEGLQCEPSLDVLEKRFNAEDAVRVEDNTLVLGDWNADV